MADGFLIGSDFLGRIRRVVDGAEAAPESGSPYRIPTRFEDEPQRGAQKTFRVCTFTGSWSIGSAKTVTFKNQTTTPNTVTAKNLLFDIAGPATSGASTTKVCIIGKEGTAWYFVNTEKESCGGSIKAKELDDSASDLSSAVEIAPWQGAEVLVNDGGCVRWVKLRKITVLMNGSPTPPLTLTGDGLQYAYKEVFVLDHIGSAQGHTIAVTACSSTTGP